MRMLRTISSTIKYLFGSDVGKDDPVCSCPVHLDHKNGGCTHVDGFLCHFPKCEIIDSYEQERNKISRTK